MPQQSIAVIVESLKENALIPAAAIMLLTLIQLATQFTGVDYLSYIISAIILVIYTHTGYSIVKNGHSFTSVITTAVLIGLIQSLVYGMITVVAVLFDSKLFLSVAFLGLPYQISKSFLLDEKLVVGLLLIVVTFFFIVLSTLVSLLGGIIARRLS